MAPIDEPLSPMVGPTLAKDKVDLARRATVTHEVPKRLEAEELASLVLVETERRQSLGCL